MTLFKRLFPTSISQLYNKEKTEKYYRTHARHTHEKKSMKQYMLKMMTWLTTGLL